MFCVVERLPGYCHSCCWPSQTHVLSLSTCYINTSAQALWCADFMSSLELTLCIRSIHCFSCVTPSGMLKESPLQEQIFREIETPKSTLGKRWGKNPKTTLFVVHLAGAHHHGTLVVTRREPPDIASCPMGASWEALVGKEKQVIPLTAVWYSVQWKYHDIFASILMDIQVVSSCFPPQTMVQHPPRYSGASVYWTVNCVGCFTPLPSHDPVGSLPRHPVAGPFYRLRKPGLWEVT